MESEQSDGDPEFTRFVIVRFDMAAPEQAPMMAPARSLAYRKALTGSMQIEHGLYFSSPTWSVGFIVSERHAHEGQETDRVWITFPGGADGAVSSTIGWRLLPPVPALAMLPVTESPLRARSANGGLMLGITRPDPNRWHLDVRVEGPVPRTDVELELSIIDGDLWDTTGYDIHLTGSVEDRGLDVSLNLRLPS